MHHLEIWFMCLLVALAHRYCAIDFTTFFRTVHSQAMLFMCAFVVWLQIFWHFRLYFSWSSISIHKLIEVFRIFFVCSRFRVFRFVLFVLRISRFFFLLTRTSMSVKREELWSNNLISKLVFLTTFRLFFCRVCPLTVFFLVTLFQRWNICIRWRRNEKWHDVHCSFFIANRIRHFQSNLIDSPLRSPLSFCAAIFFIILLPSIHSLIILVSSFLGGVKTLSLIFTIFLSFWFVWNFFLPFFLNGFISDSLNRLHF